MNDFSLRIVVPRDHSSFAGHFPGHPIVPGVLLLDLIATGIQERLPNPTRLATIPSAKFQRPVAPQEAVDVQVRVTDAELPYAWRARFQATINGAPVTEAHFLFALSDPSSGLTDEQDSSLAHG
jgi:3-hydroxymyristoyl/3-hydroxydecanoyl-(acyl carrier protein) dehydratase